MSCRRYDDATEQLDLVVVGGGQAGLAVSHELSTLGVAHVVLERGRIGQTWRGRWNSFCLVTPNWSVQLPGGAYDGPEPDGYMPRDDIVDHLERYARRFGAPVRQGIDVLSVSADGQGRFVLRTSFGEILARTLVLTTGAYQRPYRPSGASTLPQGLDAIDVEGYRDPASLPDGRVLIVGSGQSGCQIAEELRDSGREVVLACGRAPWVTRRMGDRDFVWWSIESGFLGAPLSSLPSLDARLFANVLASGHGGGHDLHLRTLQAKGVRLAGHFLGADGYGIHFADDLAESVAWGDAKYTEFSDLVRKTAVERGLAVPDMPPPPPFRGEARTWAALNEFVAVIFAGGFRPDYQRWVALPGAFDAMGFPVHIDGSSPLYPGLHFVGVHFLRKRWSSLLYGVGEDATIVAHAIARRAARPIAEPAQ